jgi:hypothetical protein
MSSNKNILYLYELPKESTTSVVISEIIKELTGYELPEAPQFRRDAIRDFYSAVVKIEDQEKYKEICQKLKYFKIGDKPCRSLPYDKDFSGANRANLAQQNIFVRKLKKDVTS